MTSLWLGISESWLVAMRVGERALLAPPLWNGIRYHAPSHPIAHVTHFRLTHHG